MIKQAMIMIGIVPMMFAGSGVALAQNENAQCRNIVGHAEVVDLQSPCQEDTAYWGCYIQKIRGTLSGTWVSYQQEDWFVDLGTLGAPVPSESPLSAYLREFEVFTTNKGTVYGDAQTVFDVRLFDSDGGGALPTIITGGTGIYQDAWGWIVLTYTDGTVEEFDVQGRICGPNIP